MILAERSARHQAEALVSAANLEIERLKLLLAKAMPCVSARLKEVTLRSAAGVHLSSARPGAPRGQHGVRACRHHPEA